MRFTHRSLLKTGESFAAARIKIKATGARIIEANHMPINGETTWELAKLSPILISTK